MKTAAKTYFPWKYFWKLSLTIFFALMILGVVIIFLDLSPQSPWTYLATFVLASFGLSLIIAYRFSKPMKRIVLKAMRLANKSLFFQMTDKESDKNFSYEDNSEEFQELENYLAQIRSKLKFRKKQIAHGYEESKTLMSAIADAVVSIDQEENVLFFNSSFASKFIQREKVQSSEKLQLDSVFNDTEIINLFKASLKDGTNHKIQKTMSSYMDAHDRIFSLSISPLRDQKTNEIFEVMGIFHDITELKWTERIRSEFVENASHELRTPLTAVKGYIELMKEDLQSGQTESLEQNMAIVDKSVNRLSHLVDDLLTLSKLEHGARPQIERIDPEYVTQDVIQKLTPLALQKRIQLTYHNHGVKYLQADADKVEQILLNLIGNGIKYTCEDGRVEVHWRSQDHHHELIIKDNGPGIDPVHQMRIFERFYRVDKARTREIGGTGLGLSIVKHMMNVHGGTVAVKSKLGEGAEFICSFPKSI